MIPVALTIAGSDPSGGAGIQADLKTFHQRGIYGASVITLITIQNSRGVKAVHFLDEKIVAAQMDAVLDDILPGAAKTGALGSAKVIRAVAKRARHFRFPFIVDPVMASKSGAILMAKDALEVLRKYLIPCASLITPNLEEAKVLSGVDVKDLDSMENAAKRIAGMGAKAVLIKGGHLKEDAADLLFYENKFEVFRAPRINSKHTHGTGCTFSAVITAEIAKGHSLSSASRTAKEFVTRAILTSPKLGKGCGPLNHHVELG